MSGPSASSASQREKSEYWACGGGSEGPSPNCSAYSSPRSCTITPHDQPSQTAWCAVIISTCSVGDKAKSRARKSGPSDSEKRSSTAASPARASAWAWASNVSARRSTVASGKEPGAATSSCMPSGEMVARSDSCRAMTAAMAAARASVSNVPRMRSTVDSLKASDASAASWSPSHSSRCASVVATTRSTAPPAKGSKPSSTTAGSSITGLILPPSRICRALPGRARTTRAGRPCRVPGAHAAPAGARHRSRPWRSRGAG